MRDDRQKPHDTKDASYQKVVSWLLKRWAEGDLPPWRKPWTPPPWPDRPHNPFTQAVYQGGNAFTLTLAGMAHDLPLFATYKQIQEHGGQVRGGEQGVPIIVWKEWRPRGEENAPEPGTPQESAAEDAPPRLFARTYAVFNIAQTDGLEHLLAAAKPPATWSAERAGALFEERVAETGMRIERGAGNRAFFRASERLIHLPVEGRFPNASTFYATLLHEAVHSTGPALDRSAFYQKKGMDRDQAYAAEELTAEIGMLLLARRLNVPIAPEDAEQTASYLKGWSLRAAVESDPKLLFETARLAQQAVDHLITPEFAQKLEAVQKTRPGQQQTLSGSLREPAPTAPGRPPLSVDLDAGERYTFHSDAGHGWLEVTRSDLKALGIEAEITPYSYVKGNLVFLEEDLDAGRFMTALERYMGKEYTWPKVSRDVDDGDHSPIRHYPRYEAPAQARVMREEKDRTVSRGDYVRYLDETGTEKEGVVLDAAQPSEATRLRGIYRWPNGTPGMDGADQIAPTALDHLLDHIPGAVQSGPDLDAIDPRTDAYKRTMGMDDSRAQAAHAVLMAVETARGVTDPALLRPHSEANKQIHHKVILTHRTDLADYVRQEPIDPDQPILEIQTHPRQRISGVLRDYEKCAVLLDTREFGPVSVEIGKPFLADSLGDDVLRKSLGKPIEVSISGDGRVLSIHNPELGVTPAKNIFASPAIPFGLTPYRNMEQKGAEAITGRLTHIHDTNVLEIQSAGQPLLVSSRDPDQAHQEAIRKMIGHTVTVTPNHEGILQVADHGPKRELGDSREIPVERLQPGDRIREGNHWMTVHSVEFPGDRIGLKNPVRIRFGDPEGDDTGSTLVPAGTRVSLRTAGILRPERSAFEGPEPAPTPDAPLPRHSEQAWEIHHKVVLTNRTDLIKAGDYIEVSHLKFASGGNERRISRGIVQSDHDGKAYQVHDIYGRGAAAKIMQGTGYLPGPENGGRVERHIPKAVPDLDKSAMLTFVHDLDERDQTVNELLDHPDWQVRANGIRDVIESMSGGQIHRALEDPDSVVRLNTLFLANRHGLAGRIDEPHARQLLSDPAPAVRGHAVGIFADRLGREGVEDFLTRETHQTPRGSAERALLRIQAEEQCLHPQFSQEAVIMPDVPETYGQRAEQQIQEPGEERAEPTGMHDAEEEIVEDLGWER